MHSPTSPRAYTAQAPDAVDDFLHARPRAPPPHCFSSQPTTPLDPAVDMELLEAVRAGSKFNRHCPRPRWRGTHTKTNITPAACAEGLLLRHPSSPSPSITNPDPS